MKIFRNLNDIDIRSIEPTVVALGKFDGVHKGHQELIRRAIESAKAAGHKSAVFTFSNNPINVMKGKCEVKNLIYKDEKTAIMEELGVDYLFDVPFTDEIRVMHPKEFVEKLLLEACNMKEAYCGFNYRFGFKAEGTPEFLMHMGIEEGFGVHVMSPYYVDGELVSSTLIRRMIQEGRVDECEKYLGRTYSVGGEVVVGNRLGKKIGFPTSNLNIDERMVAPPNGVYITRCLYNGVRYPSITNVGQKPTVGEFVKNIETHIFNFDKELYGKTIRVEFLQKLRDEKKFESVEALSEEITNNCITARAYHRSHGNM